MEPIDMKLKKCCILCMKTEHKRLCRLILNLDEEKFLQKHIGLFVVNGFICSNCKRQLRSIESKCAVIKSKCELAMKTNEAEIIHVVTEAYVLFSSLRMCYLVIICTYNVCIYNSWLQ